jgi:integrase
MGDDVAGQVGKRGDNTWLVRVFLGRDLTGKRKYYNKTIHGTKREAQQYLTKVLRERDTGILIPNCKRTVMQHIESWLETSVQARVRGRTKRDYEALAKRYINPVLGCIQLAKLTPEAVQTFYNGLTEQGKSPRTVRYTHAVLHSALEQAVRWRLIPLNPTKLVDLPRQRRREMSVLTPAQVGALREAAKPDRYYVLWMFLIATGLRPGEALGLKWTDWDGNTKLRVQRVLITSKAVRGELFEDTKTERSRRSVVLPESVPVLLASHRAKQAKEKLAAGPAYEDLGLIFAAESGRPLNYRNIVRRHFSRVLRAAGLPHMRLYDLRHTSATLLLEAGEHPKVVAERLGHSTITLTLDTYSHVLPDMQQRAADKLEAMVFGSSAERSREA